MLDGSQPQILVEALLQALPHEIDLELLARRAGVDLEKTQSVLTLREKAFVLVEAAQNQGRLEELMDAARRQRPDDRVLASVLDELPAAFVDSASIEEPSRVGPDGQRLRSQDSEPGRTDTVPTHFDRPSSADELGRQARAEVLADRLRRLRGEDTESPRQEPAIGDALLVHLHAPWGAGKTSLLNLLREELETPPDARLLPWISVTFDAWQHQRLAPPWWWLLSAVRRDGVAALHRRGISSAARFVLRDLRWRAWNARPALIAGLLIACLAALVVLTDGFGLAHKSLTGVNAAAAAVSALIALGITTWGLVRGLGRRLAFGGSPPGAKSLERVHDPMRASQRRFEFLIDALGAPIVILIDNLDRCRAEFAVELLEGIQTLFLNRPVTYVVAADRDWLCRCYEEVYKAFESSVGDQARPLGYLFLEKTFQVSLELPPIPDDALKRYWRGLIGAQADKQVNRDSRKYDDAARARFKGLSRLDEVLAALETTPDESDAAQEAWRRAAMQRLNSPDLEAGLRHALEPFADLVEANPRSMKRLVNAYGVERALRVRTGATLGSAERTQNVLWTIVRLRWPVLARHISRHPKYADILAGTATVTDYDPAPDYLTPFFFDRSVRRVFEGEGVEVVLDATGVRQFTRWGRSPSSAGA